MQFHLLHGFLQKASCWDALLPHLKGKCHVADIWEGLPVSIEAWGRAFNRRIEETCDASEAQVMVGYSMGGRLAMQALLDSPTQWSAAIFISAHPGSENEATRSQWLANDRCWARKLLSEDWATLVSEWDAQPVFGGIPNPNPAIETGWERAQLASALTRFSKGMQPDYSPELAKLSVPMLYISGELDTAYTELGLELTAKVPTMEHTVVSGAGHRAPWEKPQAFAQAVSEFLKGARINSR